MGTRICAKCKIEKDLVSCFRACLNSNKWHSYCKECQDKYLRERYARTKDRHRESEVKFRIKIRGYWNRIINQAKKLPCMDCGIRYPPVCMDFDHREGEEKISGVSELKILLRSIKHESILRNEINKCDVVCANCHRLRTAKRGEWDNYECDYVDESKLSKQLSSKKYDICECGNKKYVASKRCLNCHNHRTRPNKINWPPDDVLAKLVLEKPLTHLAKELGVSDNAIRLRCNRQGIKIPKRTSKFAQP